MKSIVIRGTEYFVKRNGTVTNKKNQIIAPNVSKHGYMKLKGRSLSKIVAELYGLKNPKKYLYVGFKDGNPSNISFNNLKYQSMSFITEKHILNICDGMRKKTRGKNHFRYRPFKIGNKHYDTLSEAAEVEGVHFTTIAARLKKEHITDHVYINKTSKES